MKKTEIDKNQIIIIAGMSRAGTTFLYHNLQKHPQVFIPPRKECGYFSYHYDRKHDWYLNFFKGINPDQISFDISGMYFIDSRFIERILKFNPTAKVILGVRDPITWIFSLYEQYTQNFKVPPFSKFLDGCSIKREGKTTASDALITILREGRQPGISLILASQQPGKIHTDVMTQSGAVLRRQHGDRDCFHAGT